MANATRVRVLLLRAIADQDASAAQIEGVPSLAVDGKYLVNSKAAGSYEDLLRITETVIAKARQDRKGK